MQELTGIGEGDCSVPRLDHLGLHLPVSPIHAPQQDSLLLVVQSPGKSRVHLFTQAVRYLH